MEYKAANNTATNPFWLRLDNVAKIYPAIKDKELTAVLRISVELKERIKAKEFLLSIQLLENRFPYYKVKLKKGFFWFYLEHCDLPIQVKAEEGSPCRSFSAQELMFRVLVRNNRISVEFSHILTDGTGALEFLKTILFTYLKLCGHSIPKEIPFIDPSTSIVEEEYQDEYNRNFKRTSSTTIKVPKAFQVKFPLNSRPRFKVIVGVASMEEIVKKAKEYKVTLTEYLTAVYLFTLQSIYLDQSPRAIRKSDKIIRIEVPMNLRKLFPSKTMRNFSLYVMPGIDLRLGQYSFEEILKVVFHQMQLETDKKLINKMISRNVSIEKNDIIRRIPLFIKSMIMSKAYSHGTGAYSGVITNLGKITFGAEIDSLIRRFIFIPPPANKVVKVNCGVVGFGNHLVFSFGNITRLTEIERRFFTFLTEQGIQVQLHNY